MTMTFYSFLRDIRRKTLEAFNRRDFNLSEFGPIVSFTFDDFPQSALHIGGSILKNYGACGTYYISMGLMDKVNNLGQHFSADDLVDLLEDGHELGSHTFDHLSACSSFKHFKTNVMKGMEAVDRLIKPKQLQQFSYPKGHVTIRAKRLIGRCFSTCRGIIPGINKSPVDLNLLRANSLYSNSFDMVSIERLFEANEKLKGWLIYYTHDISENPSPFGCRPREFESVVKLAVRHKMRIVPVGEVVGGFVN